VIVVGDGLARNVSSVLCLGAHSDDIEIGCGGTILKLVAADPDLKVHWVVLSAQGDRADEARTSAERFLSGTPNQEVEVASFRERYFPYLPDLKEFFDTLGGRVQPDLVLTHYGGDAHQDHRVVAELTWNTYRDHLILEYEIPKYDGDLARPNVFVGLDEDLARRKVRAALEGFPSQAGHFWFTEETFLGLLRLRGVEARSASGFAEGFHARKLVLA
jgi:LmbE family N-acetylglucosaminyl deacetylase